MIVRNPSLVLQSRSIENDYQCRKSELIDGVLGSDLAPVQEPDRRVCPGLMISSHIADDVAEDVKESRIESHDSGSSVNWLAIFSVDKILSPGL
jgi:hypothetical protein